MISKSRFLQFATLFQGGLILIAWLLGAIASLDPLASFRPDLAALAAGILGTLPLFLVLVLTYDLEVFSEIRKLQIDRLGPVLAACTRPQLLYVGLLAGFSEEILFRGCLQPWFERDWGIWGGLVFSNLVFALVHWITPLYALMAGLAGLYLGLALDIGGERNLVPPILIHALYDFLAFMVVARSYVAASQDAA